MLNATELASMRATTEEFLPDTCSISRATPSSDSMGGFTSSWANVATSVPCRYSPTLPSTSSEQDVSGKLTSETDWVVTLPYDQDVLVTDRIVIGSRTLEVVNLDVPRSWQVTKRVSCKELT